MRFALASCLVASIFASALAGCLIQDPHDDGTYYGSGSSSGGGSLGSGWGGGSGAYDYGCHSDAECGSGLVCARTYECLTASQVRVVHTLWTVGGDPASEATCTSAPDLSITFTNGASEQWGYTPVPCRAGKHTVDKFPIRFTTVQLSRAYDYSGGDFGTFDAQGNAQLDLPY